MKIFSVLSLLLTTCFGTVQNRPTVMENTPAKSLYDFKVKGIDGKEVNLAQYKGKKVLIVNVASKCGYTRQYEGLEKLYEQYGEKVVVLGFPSNEFNGQEPGTEEEIATFCKTKFGVKFPMFSKIEVKKGAGQHPLYKWLTNKAENGWNDQDPTWNFCKYLINEKGELVKFFPSKVEPMSDELVAAIK